MIKFETINGTLCRMVEPEPLQLDSPMPCVVRLIQDETQMGRYNRDASYSDVIGKLWVAQKIKENPYYSNTLHAYEKNSLNQDSCIASIHQLEIIGYPVAEGSAEWALYQMMQGKKVRHKGAIGNVCWALNQDGDVQYYDMDDLAYIGTIRSKLEFGKYHAVKTVWQLYEPEPEPAKEPEIVAHKQHAKCLVCGKEIKGLLDGHATVSIKRYSISSLYESTYSHYCGKCFLELGFDATERKLRNRQQPIAEPKPEPPREPEYVTCKRCGGTGYEIKPEPAPKFVVVPINISGTVRQAYNEDGTIDDEQFQLLPNGIWDGTEMFISFDALDSHTRKLVESLLKAQEEEK